MKTSNRSLFSSLDIIINFTLFLSLICFYILIYAFITACFPKFDLRYYNLIGCVLAALLALLSFTLTSSKQNLQWLSFSKLHMRADFLKAFPLCLIGIALLLTARIIVERLYPSVFDHLPFFHFSRYLPRYITLAHTLYPLTCIIQEFLARIVMQDTFFLIFFNCPHTTFLSIFLSSLIFGILHIHYGFVYMCSCIFYMAVLGIHYHKRHNLYTCIFLHFVFGEIFTSLGLGFLSC